MESPLQESIKYSNWDSKSQKESSKISRSFEGPPKLLPKRNTGPNVNLKLPRLFSPTEEQKKFFKNKIKSTKKTELCKNWDLYGDCYYKDSCSFAHGEVELRQRQMQMNQKYKTRPCKFFIENMYCPFGNRCSYKHDLLERKSDSYFQLINKFAQKVLKESLKKKEIQFEIIIHNAASDCFKNM